PPRPPAREGPMISPHYKSNFSILACLDIAQKRYQEDPGLPIFVQGNGGTCRSKLACLTLEGCWELCGGDIRGTYEYSDVFNSIATWVLPLFLLAGNINYVKSGKMSYYNYFAVLAHILSDPIDTILSYSLKIDVRRRAYMYYLERNRGGGENGENRNSPASWWRMISRRLTIPRWRRWTPTREAKNFIIVALALDDYNQKYYKRELWDQFRAERPAFQVAARWLDDVRGMNIFRAGLAIISYLFGVSVAYVRLLKSPDTPAHTSHTVALRVLYFWLIPTVVLSAVAGKFPTEWTAYEILRHLEFNCPLPQEEQGEENQQQNHREGEDAHLLRDFGLKRLDPWDGGSYSWRPEIDLDWATAGYFLFAFLCVGLSFAASFLTSWRTPTVGLGCRGLVEIFYFVAWITSFLLTTLCRWILPRRSFRLWVAVLVKDTILTLPMLVVLLGAFQGRHCLPTFLDASAPTTRPLTSPIKQVGGTPAGVDRATSNSQGTPNLGPDSGLHSSGGTEPPTGGEGVGSSAGYERVEPPTGGEGAEPSGGGESGEQSTADETRRLLDGYERSRPPTSGESYEMSIMPQSARAKQL
ncbi:hypothetical protein GP486_007641, partial [Trichoglossum hirsutum]